MLRSPAGVDVARLRHEIGVEPQQVDAFVRKLRGLGCVIEEIEATRLRLVRTELNVWQDYLDFVLAEAGDGAAPRGVRVYRRIASTQDAARDHTDGRAVVLADEQTAGRGRRGRSWVAPPGTAVLFSMAHALESTAGEPVDRLQCVAAVAVAQALEKISGRRLIQIKWPNDIIVDGRKLAGILVETFVVRRRRVAVIGVGVDVVALTNEQTKDLPPELRQRITSLEAIGCPHDRLHVAAEIILRLDRLLRLPDQPGLLDEWRMRNLMQSQRVLFRSDGRTIAGEVVDLDAEAGLIVRTDEGEMVHLHSATTVVV